MDRCAFVSLLILGLKRLEYRGYDSAGICIDQCGSKDPIVIRNVGSVKKLEEKVQNELGFIQNQSDKLKESTIVPSQIGLAHTRWATHGGPEIVNAHPHSSDRFEFVVVHNGIITNYKTLKAMLIKKGFSFYSETDTEIVPKLTAFLYHQLIVVFPKLTFHELIANVMQHLEGAFALVFRSSFYPLQIVACKRGSPLVIGLRGEKSLMGESSIQVLSSREITNHAHHISSLDSPLPRLSLNSTELHDVSEFSLGESRKQLGSSAHTNCVAPKESIIGLEKRLSTNGVESSHASITSPNSSDKRSSSGGIEYFFSSDASAIVEHTHKVFYTEDNDIVEVVNGQLRVYNAPLRASSLLSDVPRCSSGKDESSQVISSIREISTLKMELDEIMKGSFPHFMLKEIFEQPESVTQTMRGRISEDSTVHLSGVRQYLAEIKKSNRLIMIACGTSYHACLAVRRLVEELSEIPVVVELACDFLDRECPIFRSDVVICVSQSGETADTLAALRYSRAHGALSMGVVNSVGSTISRLTDFGVHLNAGSEIGVASTKAYTSQIVAMTMVALELSADSCAKQARRKQIFDALQRLPKDIENTLRIVDPVVRRIAARLNNETSMLLVGRGYHYATCLEAALKIKEVAYIHTEGINAGELKHGPLALVDESMPLILFSSMDSTKTKVLNAAQQLIARGGLHRLIVVCSEDDTEIQEIVKDRTDIIRVGSTVDCLQPILSVLPMQLLSYHLAVARGLNVDQPRNLAKAVTVQ